VTSPLAFRGPQEDVACPLASAELDDAVVLGLGEADAEDSGFGLAFGERRAPSTWCHGMSIAATETLDEADLCGYDKAMMTTTQTCVVHLCEEAPVEREMCARHAALFPVRRTVQRRRCDGKWERWISGAYRTFPCSQFADSSGYCRDHRP
jgi:hypothetical protein